MYVNNKISGEELAAKYPFPPSGVLGHVAIDPFFVLGHIRVHARVLLHPAVHAPRHDPDLAAVAVVAFPVAVEQGTSAVALETFT